MRRSLCGSYFLALHSKLFCSRICFKKIFLLRSGRKRRTLGAAVFNHCNFKFYGAFYLMPTKDAVTKKDRQPRMSEDWVVSKHKRFRASIIVWGMPKDL